MALFSSKKKEIKAKKEDAPVKAVATVAVQTNTNSGTDLSRILKHARITEKASMHAGAGVYVFDVDVSASKTDIASAIHKFYKVTPRMVRVAPIPTKMKRNPRSGKTGMRGGGKKAYVYLKKGDSITIA